MERLFKLIALLFLFTACAPGKSGFQASDYNYRRVEAPASNFIQAQAIVKFEPGSIVRSSNRITFSPIETKWNQDEVQFKAIVKFGEKSFGEVEFQGVKENSKVILTPSNQELAEKLKAQLICTSEGDTCDEFFIDVFYLDNQIIYQDQIIPSLKSKGSEQAQNEKPENLFMKRQATVFPAAPSAPAKTEDAEISDGGEIADGLGEADVESESFIGASDAEIRSLFKIPAPIESTGKSGASTRDEDLIELRKFQVKNQIIGSPVRGRLDNATDFLKISNYPGFHFFITNPRIKDYYSSFDMAVLVKKLGDALQTILPGRKLAITSLSKWGGGRLPPHQGHQNGTDADFRYLTDHEKLPSNVVTRGKVNKTLLVSQQWQLIKKAFETDMVDAIFVDKAVKKAMCEEARRVQDYKNGDDDSPAAEMLKRIQHWPGHDNHFHLRIRCGADQPRCKKIEISLRRGVGC